MSGPRKTQNNEAIILDIAEWNDIYSRSLSELKSQVKDRSIHTAISVSVTLGDLALLLEKIKDPTPEEDFESPCDFDDILPDDFESPFDLDDASSNVRPLPPTTSSNGDLRLFEKMVEAEKEQRKAQEKAAQKHNPEPPVTRNAPSA